MESTVLFWLVAALPALLYPYLLYAYARRFSHRKELIRSLLNNSDAIEEYSRAFRASKDLHGDEWKRRLDLDIESYVYPTALCALFSLAGTATLISATTENALGLPTPLFEYLRHAPVAALAGFGGAYIWGLFDFADRFRILNLPTGALHSMWFRMMLTPIAAAFGNVLFKENVAPLLGFAIGLLPVATVVSWLQDTARQRLSLASSADVPPMWEHIQGLTPDIVTRLTEAGVTSAVHLANQDPVSLLRRTNLEWRNVLDMMDQAMLLAYVGPSVDKLRVMGIRGVIEAGILYERLSKDGGTPEAEATLEAVATALESEPLVIQNLLHNLFEDPQVNLIWALWYDRAAVPSPSDQEVNAQVAKPPSEAAATRSPVTSFSSTIAGRLARDSDA